VLRYLAVAHFGRGRGDFVAGEYPPHWGPLVEQAVARHHAALGQVWSQALKADDAAVLESRLRASLEAVVAEVLAALYPDSAQR
jgi:hypothetical protein